MSDKEAIVAALESVKAKFDLPKLKPRFQRFTKKMLFTFPDLETSYLMTVELGVVLSLTEESIPDPDIHVTMDSYNLIGILARELNPMRVYTTGGLKARGRLTDLLKLQKLL